MPRHTFPILPTRPIKPLPASRQRWVARAKRRPEIIVSEDFQDTEPAAPLDYLGHEPLSTFPAQSAQAAHEYLLRSMDGARRPGGWVPTLTHGLPGLWAAASASNLRTPSLLPTDAVLSMELAQHLRRPPGSEEFAETQPYDPAAAWEDLWRAQEPGSSKAWLRRKWPLMAGGMSSLALALGLSWFMLRPMTDADCAKDPSRCAAPAETSLAGRVWAQAKEDRGRRAPVVAEAASTAALARSVDPHQPCKFVGMWVYKGDDGTNRTVVLQDDGRYLLNPDAVLTGREFTGRWHVQGTQFVWHHDQVASGQPDINPIAEEGTDHFVIVELSGAHTRFDRVGALPRSLCKG